MARVAEHTITVEWGDIPPDADGPALVGGAYREYSCTCGVPLPHRMAAELHAVATEQCSTCLGSAVEELVPGFRRGCTSCAGTGRRRNQLMWQLAHAEAELVITVDMVREVIAEFSGPFALSTVADTVRDRLGLRPGRLPVGPRVRDVLRELEAAGEIEMISAPDEMLMGPSVVVYRDPSWRRVSPAG
ncbi:hypothetical protein SAMN04489764_3872 [Thermostaphylospora chromogena]|uniref:Uncharacterized protein n=1 Tax=Thermostaphylospora chromogena TaxID=35622 RepID=A0A1H1GXF0_9ACTN|nr:hypothetical protein SAMN04489764_3872 [Thermostaphylospora chromogena]